MFRALRKLRAKRIVLRGFFRAVCQPANKQLQRTVTRRRERAARAPFHYARASRWTVGHAAAELRR